MDFPRLGLDTFLFVTALPWKENGLVCISQTLAEEGDLFLVMAF